MTKRKWSNPEMRKWNKLSRLSKTLWTQIAQCSHAAFIAAQRPISITQKTQMTHGVVSLVEVMGLWASKTCLHSLHLIFILSFKKLPQQVQLLVLYDFSARLEHLQWPTTTYSPGSEYSTEDDWSQQSYHHSTMDLCFWVVLVVLLVNMQGLWSIHRFGS